jgi:hypothetical protein
MTDREYVERNYSERDEEERSHDSGIRNSDHGTGSDTHKLPEPQRDHSDDSHDAHGRYIDPAEAVMNSNPNLSPPIHIMR